MPRSRTLPGSPDGTGSKESLRTTVLILPGLGGSGPAHWQSRWQAADRSIRRVVQRDWNAPVLADWLDTLDAAVAAAPVPVVLVAHSLACVLVAHFARRAQAQRIAAAFLVAPADVEIASGASSTLRGFAPIPQEALPFPSAVIASRADPYISIGRARFLAAKWCARFIDVGDQGHINVESGHGDWPEGRLLLDDLLGTALARERVGAPR
jgi:uncharacterized protein